MTTRLNTNTLFYLLLKFLNPKAVYDIGSFDGFHALRFRQLLQKSDISIFEANPNLFLDISKNPKIKQAGIKLYNFAVFNQNLPQVNFYIAESGKTNWRKGISSLKKRMIESRVKKYHVRSVRLDSIIKKTQDDIALWIDVEGCSFEVLEGISGIKNNVDFIHIESETTPFWKNQKLEKDLEVLAQKLNFRVLAKGFNDKQHDLIFINNKLFNRGFIKIILLFFIAWLLTYIGFLLIFIPGTRGLIKKIDIVRRL